MWVIVDDMRELGCDLVIRRVNIAKKVLPFLKDEIECLILDHDLGQQESGYDLAKWVIANNCMPNKVQICSSNPVGKKNIENVLKDNGYTYSGRFWENENGK